jgi:hypothetical protein
LHTLISHLGEIGEPLVHLHHRLHLVALVECGG